MRFTKMHGTGNDYVLVNCFSETVDGAPALARSVSDRHTGIGGDGLILICPSETAAVRMEMYNADGSRAQMCGNGIRCVAKFVHDHGLFAGSTISIETDDGVKTAECTLAGGKVSTVRIDMGQPRFKPSDVPVALQGDTVVDVPIEINGRRWTMTCLSMGNPHAVVFLESSAEFDLHRDGPAFEKHELFPERVNAHFVHVRSPSRVEMCSWERGSGPTQACGTGASAVCVAAALTGRTERALTVSLPGGELELLWSDDDHVYMTGPAVEVFNGEFSPGRFARG